MRSGLLLLFLSCATIVAQDKEPAIRFPSEPIRKADPSPPKPAPAVDNYKMNKDEIFVIDSDVECFLRMSPKGNSLKVTVEEGPIKIRGQFVGGTKQGFVETRTFKGKYVYLMESGGKDGKVDVYVIPKGLTKDLDIQSKTIEVMSGGVTPNPPPKPVPPTPPDPKPPTPPDGPTAKNIGIVIVENLIERTPAQANVINDPTFRKWVSDNNHELVMLSTKDPTFGPGPKKYTDSTGLPSVVLYSLDAKNPDGTSIYLTSFKLPNTAEKLKSQCERSVKK